MWIKSRTNRITTEKRIALFFCICSCCCVSYPVHLETEQAHLEAGARWTDASGFTPVCGGPACCVRLPHRGKHPQPVLSAQLGGHLYCGSVCTSGKAANIYTFKCNGTSKELTQEENTFPLVISPDADGQWILGLAGFLFPCSPLWFRSSLKPVHVWLGKTILILSLSSCISGINEKLLFTL